MKDYETGKRIQVFLILTRGRENEKELDTFVKDYKQRPGVSLGDLPNDSALIFRVTSRGTQSRELRRDSESRPQPRTNLGRGTRSLSADRRTPLL